MNRLMILPITLLLTLATQAQTYTQLADSARALMRGDADSLTKRDNQQRALQLLEQAFRQYPKEKDNMSLYRASYLAGMLQQKTTAYTYLEEVLQRKMWFVFLGRFTSQEFPHLINEEPFKQLQKRAADDKAAYARLLQTYQQQLEKQGMDQRLGITAADNGATTYKKIKAYHQFPAIDKRFVPMTLPLDDSTAAPYLVCLPSHYDAKKSYALLFFLHGGVRSSTGFEPYADTAVAEGWNRFFTRYALDNNVIMVYPSADKRYNWMTTDAGFFMIPEILRRLKQVINIDDQQVFLSGHSNGATGSFSYLMKQPTPFAGFFGLNTNPRIFTGGTFVKNILNRHFINFSTDQDYYYPPQANDTLSALMKQSGADYQDYRFYGYPHWLPSFDTSEAATQIIFRRMAATRRNTLARALYWECDNIQYGACDWLQITGLDTNSRRAAWHDSLNFTIRKWQRYNDQDSLLTIDTLASAFQFPRCSGAVKARYADNVFTIETSRVQSIRVYISPDMVDINRPVKVMVNGKEMFAGKVGYNKSFLLEQFRATAERQQPWIDRIMLDTRQ